MVNDVPENPVSPPLDSHWCAVVVNPSKVGDRLDDIEALVSAATDTLGWAKPRLWHTTVEDNGVAQTREALAEGASLVMVIGGDGTVRTVAGVVAGTGIPLGIVPMGTGNLLARNLWIPINDIETSIEEAVLGHTASIDVARVSAVRPGGEVVEETSVVMLGVGFDAEVFDNVDDKLKGRIGWVAYVATGLPRMVGKLVPVTITLDGGRSAVRKVRSVVVASCGTLTGGVVLLPDAHYDDGVADVLVVAPKGIAGWLSIIGWALRKTRSRHGLVRHLTARTVRIESKRPIPAQIDGDSIGDMVRVDVVMEHRTLDVKVSRIGEIPI